MSGFCDDDRHLTVHRALTSSVLLAQVGEPPDVTQAHREAHLGEDVLQLVVPGWSAVLSIWVRGGQQGLYWSSRARTQTHTHLTALIVHGVLQRQQVSHRLSDWFIAVLALGHLGVLWHGCNTGTSLGRRWWRQGGQPEVTD